MVISGVTRRARWQLIVRCMSFEALSTPDEKKMIVREYSDVCLLLEEVSLSHVEFKCGNYFLIF